MGDEAFDRRCFGSGAAVKLRGGWADVGVAGGCGGDDGVGGEPGREVVAVFEDGGDGAGFAEGLLVLNPLSADTDDVFESVGGGDGGRLMRTVLGSSGVVQWVQ